MPVAFTYLSLRYTRSRFLDQITFFSGFNLFFARKRAIFIQFVYFVLFTNCLVHSSNKYKHHSPFNDPTVNFLECFRWWPCQLVDELDLPDNIFAKPHRPCQFPAICLGTNEFSWLDMSRVYSYEDGDKGSVSTSNVSKSFKMGTVFDLF